MRKPGRVTNRVFIPAPQRRETKPCSLPGMRYLVRTLSAGAAGFWLGMMPAGGQPPPQQVISDTLEYCLQLRDRVSEMVHGAPKPPPQEVPFLSIEGQRMCDQGQTRGGILRLRRALMLMTQQGAGQ